MKLHQMRATLKTPGAMSPPVIDLEACVELLFKEILQVLDARGTAVGVRIVGEDETVHPLLDAVGILLKEANCGVLVVHPNGPMEIWRKGGVASQPQKVSRWIFLEVSKQGKIDWTASAELTP